MIILHQDLAKGRWEKLPFIEQMANIGSEVDRALNWRIKQNSTYSQVAFERALELLDLSLAHFSRPEQLKELTRVRETLVDYFFGLNEFMSTDDSLRKYFSFFTYAARKNY